MSILKTLMGGLGLFTLTGYNIILIKRIDIGVEDVIRHGKSGTNNRKIMTQQDTSVPNDCSPETIMETDVTFQGDEKSIETGLRRDSSYPNVSFNDKNSSFTSSTPMKSTERPDLNGTNDAKGCRRSQRQRRLPKYFEDYQL